MSRASGNCTASQSCWRGQGAVDFNGYGVPDDFTMGIAELRGKLDAIAKALNMKAAQYGT